jgi:mannose-6-phosphate isomerase-like protein (cupin superfamily)
MARLPHEENEAKILGFNREKLFDGVHMARVALRRGESSTRHLHTRTRDVFFVMSGRLTIKVHVPLAQSVQGYRSLSALPPEVQQAGEGDVIHRLLVGPGEVVVIDPGTVHSATNLDAEPCHFLCIEGVGEYDFVSV